MRVSFNGVGSQVRKNEIKFSSCNNIWEISAMLKRIMYNSLQSNLIGWRGRTGTNSVQRFLKMNFSISPSQLCSHTPSALNAGAKRSGAACHMAMPQCWYLAKGAKRPSHTTNIKVFFGLLQPKFIFGLLQPKFIFGLVQPKFIFGLVQPKFIFGLVNSSPFNCMRAVYVEGLVKFNVDFWILIVYLGNSIFHLIGS